MGKYEDYLKLAESDLKSSELILNSSNDELMQNIAAYHAQQAVEKIMKALKIKHGKEATITHDITVLAKDLENMDVSIPECVKENDYDISSWATTIRYNTSFKTDHDLIESVNNASKVWLYELRKPEESCKESNTEKEKT